MLTRHTQLENLSNLLSARRRQAVGREKAYRRLVATILDVTPDAVGPRPWPTLEMTRSATLSAFDDSQPRAA
jgi:hypothetical protein